MATETGVIQLSVKVPGDHTELDMEQENEDPKMSLNTNNNEEEETQRMKYGLNSPKRKNKNSDEEDDSGAMTPATKLRQTAGINSPKQQQNLSWGNVEDTKNNPLASIITQVPQNDNKSATGKGPESLVTQVTKPTTTAPTNTANDTNMKNTKQTENQNQTQSGGMCACFSSLFNCCSTPETTESRVIQQMDNQQQETKKPQEVNQVNSTTDLLPKDTPTRDEEPSNTQESSIDYESALLPPLSPENRRKRCLVLDLDETLVHSSFKPVNNADFIIPVEIDGVVHRVYVLKRPFVDDFLLECSRYYEIVIFTASLSKYADPLLDQLDTHNVISHRLFRESCTLHGSAYVKDMKRMGRHLKDTIIVDNSPHSYCFQPKNAVPITSWFDDRTDTELKDFLPVLKTTLLNIKDVRAVLDAHNRSFAWLCQQANVDLSTFET